MQEKKFTCYVCDIPKTCKTDEEHIILNALGGKLKSSEIICTECQEGKNEYHFSDNDRQLTEQQYLSTILPIALDRKTNHTSILIKNKNGQLYDTYYDPKTKRMVAETRGFEPRKVTEGDKEYLEVYSENVKGMAQKKIKKGDTSYDWENPSTYEYNGLIDAISFSYHYESDDKFYPLHSPIQGAGAKQSVLRAAMSFYILKGGERKWIKDKVELLKVNTPEEKLVCVRNFYPIIPSFDLGCLTKQEFVGHILYVRGDKKHNSLYVYYELFSVYQFLIVLSEEYDGKDFEAGYTYDLISRKERNDIDFALVRNIASWSRQSPKPILGNAKEAARQIEFKSRGVFNFLGMNVLTTTPLPA